MIILLVLLNIFFALAFTIGKVALCYTKPFFLIGNRMIIGGVLLLSYLYLFNRKALFIAYTERVAFAKVVLFHIYLVYVIEFWALQHISTARATIFYPLISFFTAILAYFLLKERLNWQKFVALSIGFLGLVPIFMQKGDVSFKNAFFSVALPDVAMLAAMFFIAYAWLLVKELSLKGYSLLFINGFSMLVGGLFILLTSFIVDGIYPPPVSEFWPFFTALLGLVFVGNIVAYNLYVWLLRIYSATFMAVTTFLVPVFGGVCGRLFLHETISWHYFIAVTLVAIGLLLFYREELKNEMIALQKKNLPK